MPLQLVAAIIEMGFEFDSEHLDTGVQAYSRRANRVVATPKAFGGHRFGPIQRYEKQSAVAAPLCRRAPYGGSARMLTVRYSRNAPNS